MGSIGDLKSKARAGKVGMSVTVFKTDSVAAVLPVQDHRLPLSNLDLLLPPVDVGVMFCYAASSPTMPQTFGALVSALKVSLAQVLVSYYPFAGEVGCNSAGEPELQCNNSGVDFVEAYADIDLHQLDLYNPDESIEGKLVPVKKRGTLAIQATEFNCGGVVVACTFDHRIADAYSANMFLSSWAEMSRSSSFSMSPSFRRTLLNPRCHPLDPAIDDMYVTISSLPPPNPECTVADEDCLISRIFHVPADQLKLLQEAASSDDSKRTKLESFSSYLWKLVAKSSYSANPNTGKMRATKMGIVVDGRTKLRDNDLSSYFGNILSIPFGEKALLDIADKPLNWIADGVHDFIQSGANEEHFLGLIDWVEAHRPIPGLAKIYCGGTDDGPAFVVSSGLRFPLGDIDFGWGRPVFGTYHFPWGGSAGYVMPLPSPVDNGDWIVYMHLTKRQLRFIESEAAHVFKPLTFPYLERAG